MAYLLHQRATSVRKIFFKQITARQARLLMPGGGGKELFSQLAKRLPSVVVRVDFLDFLEARSEPTEEIRNA